MFCLTVAAEDFAEAVKRHLGTVGGYPVAYLSTDSVLPTITACYPDKGFMVFAGLDKFANDLDEYKRQLEIAGFRVYEGAWHMPEGGGGTASAGPDLKTLGKVLQQSFIAGLQELKSELAPAQTEAGYLAIAGFTGTDLEDDPFLWAQLYSKRPTETQAIEDMLAWLVENEGWEEQTMEEFQDAYYYNVLITTLDELR
jgi:hypothetical protein